MAPANSDTLLGSAQLCLQNFELAERNVEQTVRLDPPNDEALVSLGELQLRSGSFHCYGRAGKKLSS